MEQTVVIIKPDGVKRKLIGRIIQRLEDRGLIIRKMQQRTLDVPLVKAHYAHLRDFALNASENIIHASDSPEAATIEIQRFFPQ